MKPLLLFLLFFSILESKAESEEEVPTWSALATRGKPEGRDFEKEFRSRHFYLVSQGLCTRIPKESILHLPGKYRASVGQRPEGRQVNWIEFLSANRSWLKHQNVTWAQVLGTAPLARTTLDSLAIEGRLVIATYQGGPVTVVSPSEEEDSGKQQILAER